SAAAAVLWLSAAAGPAGVPAPALLWLAWLGWPLVSAASSAEPLVGFGAAGEAAAALLVLGLASNLDDRARRRWTLGLLAAGILLAAAAFVPPALGQARFTGLLPPYYNYTACLEAASVAAAAAVLAGGARGGERWLAAAAIAAGLIELGASGSRGGAAGALLGATVALRRSGRPRLAAALAAAAIAGALALPGGRAALMKSGGANTRPLIWSAAVEIAKEHPALGEGPGLFERGALRHDFPSDVAVARYGLRATHAHSEWLELAAETGWIGLALFLAAWASSAAAAFEQRRSEPALAAFAAMSLQAAFDNVLALPWLRLVYASALGLCLPPALRAKPGPAWRAACAAGLLLAVWGRWPKSVPPPADRWETEAREALRARPPDAAKAEAAFARAYSANPYRAALPLMLGELAAGRGDWEKALARAREAQSLEPEFLEARLLEAEALRALGDGPGTLRALARLEDARERLALRPVPLNDYDRIVSFLDEKRFASFR
ncbi:MAG: O-antigen ligase family protein, partial [Elusimicrobia bacterium]|nr:O-antigen ligase family protein [Elusimicrobiota bacterium]